MTVLYKKKKLHKILPLVFKKKTTLYTLFAFEVSNVFNMLIVF